MQKIKQHIPILTWLPTYTKSLFRKDLIAGLTVGVMLVPQGMAYALLAGMPPIYGLYAGIIPLILYAIFGTSRHLSIGPVAVSALLVLAGISQIAEPGTEKFISLVILTGLLIGVLQLLLGLLKMGFLTNFLSHPVIAGFTSAAAVIIIISQLKYLLGMEIPRFEHLYETVGYVFRHFGAVHFLTLGIGLGAVILMLLLKRIKRNIPVALVTVILGIGLVAIFHLENNGVAIVGKVPEGLPTFYFPDLTWANIKLVFPTVLTVTIIGVVESIGIAKSIEVKKGNYKVIPNQELLALGLSKIFGAFFQALPTSGSFTRSAINESSGGKTQISSVISAIFVIFTLLFLIPVFYFLPQAVLAGIVIMAVKSLFDYQEAIYLWKTHRVDFLMMLTTFVVTLAVNIEAGVLAGVVLSVLAMTYKSSKPHVAVLGKLAEGDYFRNVERFPEAEQYEEVLIVRFDAPLYFTNADFFKSIIIELANQKGDKLEVLILEASSILEMDSTGLHAISEVHKLLKSKGVDMYLSGVIGPIRDLLHKAGVMEKIGWENQFMRLNDALECFLTRHDEEVNVWTKRAIQTNNKN